MPPNAIVYIVDDDHSVRTSLQRLCQASSLDCESFSSADSFLASSPVATRSCVVSDIRMPGTSGLGIPDALATRGLSIPVIFVTAHDSEKNRDRAQEIGASSYFRKPIDERALLDAIAWAIGSNKPV